MTKQPTDIAITQYPTHLPTAPHQGAIPKLTDDNINITAQRTSQMISYYQKISKIQWKTITLDKTIKPNDTNKNIPLIRQRLFLLGDINRWDQSDSETYDIALQKGIRQFQWRHGIEDNSNIDKATIEQLNITPKERLHVLQTSVNKWNQFSDIENHYILVNVPDFSLRVVKGGREQYTTKVITGKSWTRTPEINSKVETIVYNPRWNVPTGIARFELAPRMIKDPDYLANENIEVVTTWLKKGRQVIPYTAIDWHQFWKKGSQYKLSQTPGDHNALGRVKFLFDSNYDVYMHDTPHKKLFDRTRRSFSHGCIRVKDPLVLANYVLMNSNQYNPQEIQSILQSYEPTYVSLKKPINVHITYILAWVDNHGILHFRNNIYKKNYI